MPGILDSIIPGCRRYSVAEEQRLLRIPVAVRSPVALEQTIPVSSR